MENKEKLSLLFEYIKQFSQLKTKIVKDVSKQPWHLFLKDLPLDDEFVKLSYADEDNYAPLLEIYKPEFSNCPSPSHEISVWLDCDWRNFKENIVLKETWMGKTREAILDDWKFLSVYDSWYNLREEWVEEQKHIEKVRNLFLELYRLKATLDRDSETYELMVGDGIISDTENSDISHPVLLRKINIDFDAEKNKISFSDSDSESEIYGMLLNEMQGLNYAALSELKEELYINDYHPLDRVESREFLKITTHKLCAESKFIDEGAEQKVPNSDRIIVSIKPVFFLRKKLDGTAKLIEKILESISNAAGDFELPKHLLDIIGGGINEIDNSEEELSISQKLAAVGGEDENILLAKEANSEQLEIAKRISKYNAVLVQGPPGTGKTHTIANLLGNFLAEGKTVLVTSQTRKALSVLKEKIPENIQSLCVSLLADKNEDMERSIDGITEKMSKYNSFSLRKKADEAKTKRLKIINDLAETRKRIYDIKFQEFKPIVYNGEEISPIEAAKFVNENAEELSIIPGNVEIYKPLPMTFEELSKLYRTNKSLSASDEKQLELNLPCPEELFTPNEFDAITEKIDNYEDEIFDLAQEIGFDVDFDYEDEEFELIGSDSEIEFNVASYESLSKLGKYIEKFKNIEEWEIKALVDGMKGGSHVFVWKKLVDSIKAACECEQRSYGMLFDKNIIVNSSDTARISAGISSLRKEYHDKGKVSALKRLADKNIKFAEENVLVNGKIPSTEVECVAILFYLELQEKRETCARYWDNLISQNSSIARFNSLDDKTPEYIAEKFIPQIENALNWYKEEFDTFKELFENAEIKFEEFFEINKTDSEETMIKKIFDILSKRAYKVINICELFRNICDERDKLQDVYGKLRYAKNEICKEIYEAFESIDSEKYGKEYSKLVEIYNRYEDFNFRKKALEKIYDVAPGWANAIENREGLHGEEKVPANIADAWKWKQYSAIISDIAKEPFDELQDKASVLSKKYREATAELVEWEAWYNLSRRTEGNISMRQALNGWKQTIKKIGKGKGKYAAEHKAKARDLMKECQEAVPVWIMPLGKVVENFEPGKNLFDIMIVDEASQSDISSLAALFLAKKIIIVGDDKQVSPMSVGLDLDKMGALVSSTIKDKIPNAHLYDGTSSLYDIAGTVYPALMLKEHFRCVPDIIGYSNKLSYDGMIKPLRDANGVKITPAVVNYRVDGHRENTRTVNVTEARAIVAAIESCLEREEYKGKTFGVITLLGEEQAKYIENLIFERIDVSEIEERKILCGNSAQFQGDERDIIFLSMVDSNEKDGPLPMLSNPNERETKRYNVAASRAKDQLWVVNSLDASKDLKVGDLRRGLLEYASNPTSFAQEMERVTAKSESVFEENVAKALVSKGYKIIPQWEVGAYRIDMVAVSGNKKIAIECDGEMWHSGEEKVREDMERQTILERIGWKFIRIRGSEYFRNPEKTIERVVKSLEEYGIEPTDSFGDEVQSSTELLDAVKIRMNEILSEWEDKKPFVHDPSSIKFALNSKQPKVERKASEKKKPVEKEAKITKAEELGQISIFDTRKKDDEKISLSTGKKGIVLSPAKSYLFTVPESFKFEETEIKVKSWRNLYVEFIKVILNKYPQEIKNLVGRSIVGKGIIDIQTEQRKILMYYPKQISENLYVETSLDIDAIVLRIVSLLAFCGKKAEALSVYLSDQEDIENKIEHFKNWASEEIKGDGARTLLLNLSLANDIAVENKIISQALIFEKDPKKAKEDFYKLFKNDDFLKFGSIKTNRLKSSLEYYFKYLQKK